MKNRSAQDGFGTSSRLVASVGWAVLLMALAVPAAGIAAVYRCPDGSGGVVFQQVPCVQGEEVELDVRTTKWVASPKRPLPDRRRSSGSRSNDQAALARVADAERKQKQACWKANQRIERIEAELRRGYKPARGERLRQQRREQEDYLREFCR